MSERGLLQKRLPAVVWKGGASGPATISRSSQPLVGSARVRCGTMPIGSKAAKTVPRALPKRGVIEVVTRQGDTKNHINSEESLLPQKPEPPSDLPLC